MEASTHLDDARRKQAASAVDERGCGTTIDDQLAPSAGRIGEPVLPAREAITGKHHGSVELARSKPRKDVLRSAVAQNGGRTGTRCGPRGLELRDHAAASERVRRSQAGRLDLWRDFFDHAEERRLGLARHRLLEVQAVDVGQDDEQVRTDQVDDLGRQVVVVPEADLVGGDRVVLVHDRHDAEA